MHGIVVDDGKMEGGTLDSLIEDVRQDIFGLIPHAVWVVAHQFDGRNLCDVEAEPLGEFSVLH